MEHPFPRIGLLLLAALVPAACTSSGSAMKRAAATSAAKATSAAAATSPAAASVAPAVKASSPQAAGKYLVQVGGCNDCHTPGWLQHPGQAPESQWLTGITVGFRGPWGTSYPKNLRLLAQRFSVQQWLATLRKPDFAKPPMPVYDVNHMSDSDLRAIYAFLKDLGPAGKAAPADLPPGQMPKTPYINFAPVVPNH